MDKIEQLYNLYLQKGLITSATTLDVFRSANADQQSSLYELGKKNNLFATTGLDQFQGAWSGSAEPVSESPVQTATNAVSAALKKKEGSASMASPSAGSSSGLPQQQEIDLRNIEIVPSATGKKQVTFPAIKDIDFAGMVQKKEEEEAATPEFYKTAMGTITPDLIDTKEEYAVPQLNYQFGPMGFKFEEYAPGDDYMLVTAPNDEKHYVNLFAGANSKSEAEKLKKFIDQNTNVTGLKSLEKQYSNENKKILNDQQVDTEFKSLEEKVTVFKNDITSFLGEKQRLEAEKSAIESVPEKDRNTVEYKQRKLNLDSDLTTFEQRGSELLSRESEMQVSAKNLEKAVGKYTEMKASQGTVVGGALNALLTGQGTQSSGAVGAAIDIAFSKYVAGIDQSDIEKQITDTVATGDPEEDKKTSVALSAAYRINQTNKDYQDKYNQEIEDQRARGVKEELMVAPIAPKYMSANIPMPAKGQTERDWYNSLTEDQKTALVDKSNDDIKKDLKKSVLPAVRDGLRIVVGDDNTTTQWTELKKQGFWGGALLGVTESLPAMVGSNSTMGWAQRTAQMYAQTTDAVYKEMENDPNFANVSESEKLSVVAPIGIATAVLETMGLRNIVANKGVMNRIVLSAMGRAGATTTAKTFGELVKNEVNSMLGKGLLTLTGAALAEAETGAAQQAAEYYYKDIYNKAKEKEMFQTPEFLSADYIKDVAKAGAQEAVGGFVLGMPKAIAVAHAKRGYLSMDDGTFKMFEAAANDSKIQRAYVISLKQDVSMGKITWQEAKESLDDYRSSVGLFRSIPEGLTTKGKKEAMNLLQEKKTLEQQIDGKEESLVRKQKDRIKEIEAELNELTNEPAAPEMPIPTGASGNKIQVLTDEEEKRRVSLEEAIGSTIRTNPDELSPISVSIGDETISVEDAKKELQILNEKANAVQESSAEGVLPREQGTTTETGGQREGMGQGIQGQESTQEGTQEKVEQPEEGFVLKGRSKGYHEYTYNGTNVTLEYDKDLGGWMYFYETENGTRQGGDDVFRSFNEAKNALALNLDEENARAKARAKAKADQQQATQTQTQEQAAPILSSPETTTVALEQLPSEERTVVTFMQEDGTQTPVMGNEKMLSDLYHAAQAIPEADRTESQQSAIDAIEVSLGEKVRAEQQKVQEAEQKVEDETVYPMEYPSMDEVPLQFRDRVEEVPAVEIEARRKVLGFIPVGKKITVQVRGPVFRFNATGKELREANIEAVKPINQGPVASDKASIFRNTAKAMASIFPDLKITNHKNASEMRDFAEKNFGTGISMSILGDEGGMIIYDSNDKPVAIMINDEVSDATTMPHEAWHGILIKAFGRDENLFSEFRDSIKKRLVDNGFSEIADQLDEFSQTEEYTNSNSQAEEWLVQLGGLLTSSGITADNLSPKAKTLLEQIKDVFNDIAVRITGKKMFLEEATAEDVLDFMVAISDRMRRGESIAEFFGEQAQEEKSKAARSSKQKTGSDAGTIAQVRNIATRYNINNQGFAPRQVDEKALARDLALLGYGAKRSRTTGDGYGGSVFITAPNGRFYNPFKASAQRMNLGAGRLTPSVSSIQGYDQMVNILSDLMDKRKRLGDSNDAIMKKLMDVVTTLPAYQNANDSQREQIIRNIQTEMGKRLKSAPSVGKLLGTINDIKKITMAEKDLLKRQIKDLARGAKDAKIAWMKVSKELAKSIKEMVLNGKITTRQMANVISRFSRVNVFNEDSIDKFVEYMANIFADAEYASKMETANKYLSRARKNVSTKIGMANSIAPDLKRLFAIKPSMIPMSVLDEYIKIVEAFGQRAEVLSLDEISEVEQAVSDILFELDQEVSKAEELTIRFDNYVDKELDDDGNILYAETVAKMLAEDEITKEEAEIMRKYKSAIMPAAQEAEMTEQEIEAEKNTIINGIRSNPIDSSVLSSADEKSLADRLESLLKPELLKKMTIAQLNNVAKLIELINNGYMPHFAELTAEKLQGYLDSDSLIQVSKDAKILKLANLVASIKTKFTGRTSELEAIRRGPLYFIDQLFGDFKTKRIYEAVFEKISKAQALFDSSMKETNKRLDNAHNAVAKSFGYNSNKTLMSSFKMMTYMLQLEYESNPGNKEVNKASGFLNETIKMLRQKAMKKTDLEADMLQEILDEYSTDGEIDIQKLNDSFNNAEINAINEIRSINDELSEKAAYTAAVIRGKRINPIVNYVHHFTRSNMKANERSTANQLSSDYNSSRNPSTKAMNLLERQKKVTPINFDVFASAQRGAKFTMLDYHMTSAIRTGRIALNNATTEINNDPSSTRNQRRFVNAVSDAFEEAVSNVLVNNFVSDTFADDVINEISRQGYRAVLASAPRFVSELSSNMGFAVVADPKSFAEGIKYKDIIMGHWGVSVMNNSKSSVINRVYSGDTLGGRLVDTSIISQSSGIKSAGPKSDVANATNMIYNRSLKKYKNFVEMTADALISTPDKLVMRPIWFGAFANEFKKSSGRQVDFEKIAANDEVYMKENAKAIESATRVADEKTVLTGATDNPFMGILKGARSADQATTLKAFNNFNSFMTRFAIYEYTTARTGIYAAMGNGTITRKQGAALLAAVTTRMTVYTLLTNLLGNGLVSMFSDEDDEDEKTFMQKFGQALASTFTSLALGRDFGNFAKGMINYGVEEMNEEFLSVLRNGDYDPYKDAIGYSFIPKPKEGRQITMNDFNVQMMGAFGPAMKTLALTIEKMFEAPKKQEAAIERSKKVTRIRIPLEILGNSGMVPLYKDVHKVVMDQIYKDLKNADKKTKDKKEAKEEKLHGYENRSDMKRYDPKLYEEVFGSESPGYDSQQAKKKIEKQMDKIEQERKDKMYNYTPKSEEKKAGFGSKKFGGSDSKTKGFGSKKFGGN